MSKETLQLIGVSLPSEDPWSAWSTRPQEEYSNPEINLANLLWQRRRGINKMTPLEVFQRQQNFGKGQRRRGVTQLSQWMGVFRPTEDPRSAWAARRREEYSGPGPPPSYRFPSSFLLRDPSSIFSFLLPFAPSRHLSPLPLSLIFSPFPTTPPCNLLYHSFLLSPLSYFFPPLFSLLHSASCLGPFPSYLFSLLPLFSLLLLPSSRS